MTNQPDPTRASGRKESADSSQQREAELQALGVDPERARINAVSIIEDMDGEVVDRLIWNTIGLSIHAPSPQTLALANLLRQYKKLAPKIAGPIAVTPDVPDGSDSE